MSKAKSTTTARGAADAQNNAVALTRSKPGVKTAVGTAVAAATLAAVAVLSGPIYSADAVSILAAPANSVQSRIAGVQQDMARAVALQQVTPEQAAFLEGQLVRRIQST
ncbi:hypothetical protein [Arthrobacter cryoconiti]|uniref:Uncharacterized protein n=1 Tax=Arthrobacter cryoconiti TaxID=748907 RepID=A0ABV8R2N2_9MICC|nr:hypothetical protein [Arthrobacter cryoconiti]MCC9069787.1 hypothetical protein [Arthrobacter cryoconiti]